MRVPMMAAALLAGGSALAQAQTVQVTADELIAARQAAYDLMGGNFADMKRAVEAKSEVKPFKANAEAIGKWARAVPTMFPPGTETGHNTKALPAVWSDRPGFEKRAAALMEAADTLAKAADADDQAAFASAFQTTAKACGGCHHDYRAK